MSITISLSDVIIDIDFDLTVPEKLLDMDEVNSKMTKAVEAIKEDAIDFWTTLAGQNLKSTRDRYIQAIRGEVTPSDNGTPLLTLSLDPNDPLIIAIEDGAPGFDMKPGLLKGRMFRVIPIEGQFRTVSASEASAGKFLHPGWLGLNLVDDLEREILDNLYPKHIISVLAEIFE